MEEGEKLEAVRGEEGGLFRCESTQDADLGVGVEGGRGGGGDLCVTVVALLDARGCGDHFFRWMLDWLLDFGGGFDVDVVVEVVWVN